MGRLSCQAGFMQMLDELPEEAQDQVVDFVHRLASKVVGVPGKQLESLAGTLDPEQARLVMKAMDEDCGR